MWAIVTRNGWPGVAAIVHAGAEYKLGPISLTYKGKQTKQNDIVVYQIRGNVLSGVYGYGGTLAARTHATLQSALQSAKNLRQIEILPANVA